MFKVIIQSDNVRYPEWFNNYVKVHGYPTKPNPEFNEIAKRDGFQYCWKFNNKGKMLKWLDFESEDHHTWMVLKWI